MRRFSWPRRRRNIDRPLTCAEVGKVLQHYLDDELDNDRRDAIAEHLEACRRCGLELDAYLRIKTSLAAHGPVAPDDPALGRLHDFARQLLQADHAPDL